MPNNLSLSTQKFCHGKHLISLVIAFLIMANASFAQDVGSAGKSKLSLPGEKHTDTLPSSHGRNPVRPRSFIVPGILFGYGLLGLYSETLQEWNRKLQEEIMEDNPHQQTNIDNYLQFAPAAMVFGLHAFGVKGRNTTRDAGMIYLMSNIILIPAVTITKRISHELRPNGSDYYSFPSGHTTEAFASAEFLRQEYKDVSPWYGVAGYAMAITTGYLRMYNNEHWFSDVVAGAGLGIASTRLAYWIYPKISHRIFKDKPVHTMVLPSYRDNTWGFALAHTF